MDDGTDGRTDGRTEDDDGGNGTRRDGRTVQEVQEAMPRYIENHSKWGLKGYKILQNHEKWDPGRFSWRLGRKVVSRTRFGAVR